MPLTQSQLNDDILRIKVSHAKLGDDYAKSLAYGTGNFWYLQYLCNKAELIGIYVEILEMYNADGSDEVENVLTNAQIESIIDSAYRETEEWNI